MTAWIILTGSLILIAIGFCLGSLDQILKTRLWIKCKHKEYIELLRDSLGQVQNKVLH